MWNSFLLVCFLKFITVSLALECWWSGCQPTTWAKRGCYPAEEWKQADSQPCNGGHKYQCCRRTSPAVTTSAKCWWSGCQPKHWAERGCFPANDWKMAASVPCPGGDKYQCCSRTSAPDAGNQPKPDHSTIQVTWPEFQRAVTLNGYSSPSQNQYKSMVSQAKSAGGIQSKQELAMFLAQILWESGGLKYKREIACLQNGCPGVYDSSVGVPGKNYYGRGYIQLTHSYNYKSASMDLYGDLRLIQNPDMVADDENVAWATAFWYWRTRVRSAPHVLDFYFGASTRAINGALECGGGFEEKARKRYQIYKNILTAFNLNVKPIESGCYN